MEYKQKYLKYKQKYLKYKQKYIDLQKNNSIKKNLSGGSYTISSSGITEQKHLIVYPEVSILLHGKLGTGGSGSVQLGTIIECNRDITLIGKKVAIKSFFPSSGFTEKDKKEYEKKKMTEFGLDINEQLIEIPNVAILYFDITTGPLQHRLIYEYGGNTLCNYIRENPEIYNTNNNKRIMRQLFKILFKLSKKDNMQNDIKCDNIVYKVNPDNTVDIKLIDFGASLSISKLNSGGENFGRRTNMNTPETIYNHLLHNNNPITQIWAKTQNPSLNNFDKWYYYPFVSVVYFLYTGREYSTGNGFLYKYIQPQPSKEHWKQRAFELLSDNTIIIDNIKKINIPEKEKEFIKKLIEMMCKQVPSERASPEKIIEFLSK
jgi:hypothetical protein